MMIQKQKIGVTILIMTLAVSLLFSISTATAEIVTIGLVTDVNTLDPHKTATVGTDLSVISHLYTNLVNRSPDLKLSPGLALSWETKDDLTWHFKFRTPYLWEE